MLFKKFNVIVKKSIPSFNKVINVDSDKSLSIRSLLIGSISQNKTYINNILDSEDVFSTINCLKKLGVKITKKGKKSYTVYGKGLGSLTAKKGESLNFGNSGTLARLLIGILTTTPNIDIRLRGDHSLSRRSMKKLINLMSLFGAFFLPKNKYNFPLRLISSKDPIGIQYSAGVSAQLKSAVIFAGLNSFGNTVIKEKARSRDHTENLLIKNKLAIKVINKKEKVITVHGKKSIDSINVNIPGDPSAAAFFSALTLLKTKAKIKVKNVGLNPTRIGFYKLLKKNGANIKFKNIKKVNNETVGDILVRNCKMRPLNVSKEYYVNTTDEYPILFVVAGLTKGISIFKGISDLANKESNRIKEMQKVLIQVGIKSKISKNGLKIFGKGLFNAKKKKIVIPNLGDHRICMSSFILAILTGAQLKIKNFETVFTSSPSFLKIIKSLGATFEIQK